MKRLGHACRGTALAAAVLAALLSDAQAARPDAGGVRLGLNFARLDGSSPYSDRKFGVAVGGYVTYELNDQFAFQPEILYSMKGGENATDEARQHYLEYQALARFAFTETQKRPVLLVGLSAGFRLKDEVSGPPPKTELDSEFFELALVYGAGVEFPVGLRTMSVDLRFSRGITDVPRSGNDKNDVMTIMVGYSF